jgi:TolA-binding protein
LHYGLQGKPSPGAVALSSPGSSPPFSQSPSSYTTQNPGSNSIISDFFEPYQSLSSPGSVEVSSEIDIQNSGMDHLDRKGRTGQRDSSAEIEVTQALRRLEEQLSLNEERFEEISQFRSQDQNSNDSNILEYERENSKQDQYAALLHGSEYIDQYYRGHAIVQDNSNDLELLHDAGYFLCLSSCA